MTTNKKPTVNPFAKKANKQLSRRAFTKGVFTAGIALAAIPVALPKVLNASTMASLPIDGSLRAVISAQLKAFDNQVSLASAVQNEAFHNYLGQQLVELHPASAS